MPFVSVGELLAPISVEDASGPNLEYDADFATLERTAVGKPEQQMGATIVPAEDPDWKVVAKQAQALFARSKDLRVGVHLAKALLRTGGYVGFGEAVAVLRGLVDGYWDSVHPRLDPEDDNDPTMRVNALAALADGPTLTALRNTPFVVSKVVGKFGLRDLSVALGETPPPPDQPAVSMATIEGALDSIELDVLTATTTAAKNALDDVNTIETLVTEKVGGSQAVNFSKLRTMLGDAFKHLAAAQARRSSGAGAGDGSPAGDAGTAPAEGGAPARRSGMPGQVNTRDDVTRALDQIIAYYERHEPSHPLPVLMKRAKRMVNMTFLEIMKDVAPDAVPQAALLRGHSDQGES